MTAATERSLEDWMGEDFRKSVYVWVTPDDLEEALRLIRQATSIWLVEIDDGRLLVECSAGQALRSIVNVEGKDNVELAYGSRYDAYGVNMTERPDIAKEDVKRCL